MGKYEDMYKESVKDGQTENLTPEFHTWTKGDEIIGQFISKGEVVSGQGTGVYNQYMFDTDEGLIKFALGQASDKELTGLMRPGEVYRIVYEGKVKISGGRSVNKFKAEHVLPPEGSTIVPGDEPPF